MTNSIAITLFFLIVAIFAVDHFWLHQDLPLIVAKSFDSFIEYLSFWR
ncbi:hypothetical protein JJJ17_05045 [Paracoccus caeni]|uniref:Uncharacterized protein n=1 Tax=Paracoccus caeni TaxID=657651 RepID=A0A934SDE0_9RHOB|nr:hypothetical protein [Paracoccus caeni]MBK4215289.1 hypothetical protein [Paracoccus caeni]